MRRLIAIAVFALALCASPCANGFAASDISVRYVSNGAWGQLTLMGATGLPYMAVDSSGRLVSQGVAQGEFCCAPVFGAADGPLMVRVGDVMLSAVDRDGQWE